MKVIEKTNNQYKEIVDVIDSDNYTIMVKNIPEDSLIACPFDATMRVFKTPDGKVLVSKKSKLNPF